MFWFVLLGVTNLMANPMPDLIRPVLASNDTPERFADWQKSIGKTQSLACEAVLENHALLCFRYWDGTTRRWVTQQDLVRWQSSISQLRGRVLQDASQFLDELQLKHPVDMKGTYYELAHGDGGTAIIFIAPELIGERIGATHLLAAAPNGSIAFVWEPGNAELDAAIGIAVKNTFEQGKDAVTPVVFYWKNGGWVAYGEAKARKQ